MKSVVCLYPCLELIISRTGLKTGGVQILQIEFHSDMLFRYVSLGKLDNRFSMRICTCC